MIERAQSHKMRTIINCRNDDSITTDADGDFSKTEIQLSPMSIRKVYIGHPSCMVYLAGVDISEVYPQDPNI
jgi:hypothetical protein